MPRKPKDIDPATPGGKLRALREGQGLSLTQAAALYSVTKGAGGDAGHLSRLEQGKDRPSRETLDILLTMYEANPFEQWQIRVSYGYNEPLRLPTDYEIRWAIGKFRQSLLKEALPMPIYLLDYGQRLLDWNNIMPRLVGLKPTDEQMKQFYGCTTFDLALNPLFGATFLIDNADEFLPEFFHDVWCEFQPYINTDWYNQLEKKVIDLISKHPNPRIRPLWDLIKKQPCADITSREIGPIRVAKKEGDGYLQFMISATDMIIDQRFRIVRYIPIDNETLTQCQIWSKD